MRVSINHETVRRGFILKATYHEVQLKVAFTHEEKQIIRQRNLLQTKLMDRRPANAKVDARDEKFELRIEHLMDEKLDKFLAATPSQSKIYEEQLLHALAQLKVWLEDNAETSGRTVVEF